MAMSDAERALVLERLMHEYGNGLVRLCYACLRDEGLAHDAAQEAFFKAWRALDALRAGETERAWLYRIAINTCRDMQRGAWARHISRRALEDVHEPAYEMEACDQEPLRAVLALPPKDRQAVFLHYYQGFSQEEIARVLGVPSATVRSRLMRARKKLKKALKGWYFDA